MNGVKVVSDLFPAFYYNIIGLTHVFPCYNVRRVPRNGWYPSPVGRGLQQLQFGRYLSNSTCFTYAFYFSEANNLGNRNAQNRTKFRTLIDLTRLNIEDSLPKEKKTTLNYST
jgi:hypothetical protein